MGGGGGGGYFGGDYTPSKYKEILKESQSRTENTEYEAEVSEIISQRLAGSTRDSDTTSEHLDELREVIEEEGIGAVDMRFGGSVKKHTYVDGLSDVDVFLCIDKTDLADASPTEVLNYVKNRIQRANLSDVREVSVGRMAVTVTFADGEQIQLLPANRKGDGYEISNGKGDWSHVVRPDKFASKLTEVNQQNNGKVVPVVKLAKGIISQLPEDQQVSGYHVESMAIEIFKSYPEAEPRTPKAMLRYFFEHAKDIVKTPIKDKTNQSIHVDDDLGPENSPERVRASYTLDRISRKMKNADEVRSTEEWEEILGE
jgi:hypothetical protein